MQATKARPATVGIDLASDPGGKGTAACLIEWDERRGQVAVFLERLTNTEILELIRRPGVKKVGIDAPFGWPRAFVEALSSYATSGHWPVVSRKELEFRTTDRYVRELQRQWPLSVSTNYISYLAFRCAELLTELAELAGPIDRTGAGLTVEVYPAGALRQWGRCVSRIQAPKRTERRSA